MFLIFGLAESAQALRHARNTADIAQQADVIVMGRVLSLEPQWTDGETAIHTRGTIAVAEVLKGKVDGQILEFSFYGGDIGEKIMGQEDGVSLFVDEAVVLFLSPVPGDGLWVDSFEEARYYGQGEYCETDNRDRIRREIQQALGIYQGTIAEARSTLTPGPPSTLP